MSAARLGKDLRFDRLNCLPQSYLMRRYIWSDIGSGGCAVVRTAFVLALVTACQWETDGADFSERARRWKEDLASKIMPYWYDKSVDWERGGYVLSDDAFRQPKPATEKQIVTQARMVWGFSHFYLKGWRDPKRDYLKAAQAGYRFLLDHFRDPLHGGYYWKTTLAGQPINDRKYLYGEAFVIYAMVEYYRAGGDKAALKHALDLFKLIQQHCHDKQYGGWGEHYDRQWRLITQQDDRIEVELAGYKSANAHLHWMEALSELADVTGDPEVVTALEEALKINATWFYPPDPGKSAFHRHQDWKLATGPRSDGLSYGHNVEFAWLMIRAEQVLKRTPSWGHFEAIVNHALKYGYDHQRGGLYNRGFDDQPATDTDKVWWSQAELLAALTDGLAYKPGNTEWSEALGKLLDFIETYQVDKKDGIWLDTVTADGKPKSSAKAHNWKANYHDVRAIVKFIERFDSVPAMGR
ncbi:MAG: AGE family epimerase/isomerase [Verrucomicrobiae bacterium]|nr:AGE family epimerase/isomerase [Verrucomicrobiae bacterium]